LSSHNNNVNGFVNLLEASRLEGIKRFVYASSSSVYGNTKNIKDLDYCKPVSFYGITKHVNDLYAKFYSDYFSMECVGLRYHNVFGKRQSFGGEYSAVIPIFITTALKGEVLCIHGDGTQYRDFTHVSNVVHANILAMLSTNIDTFGKSFDIGSLTKININQLSDIVLKHTHSQSDIKYIEKRNGDIHASFAHMPESKKYINYTPIKTFDDGILETVEYYSTLEKI
jgi:UDP-N-acetylglucosamine 4-epimerase